MSNSSPCFWHQFEQNKSLFCEEQLCGFIVEPANTWTNIGYLIVVFFIARHESSRAKTFFLTSTFILFIGSTLFHATGTYWGKFIDVSAMFFVSCTMLNLSLQRYFQISDKKSNLIFSGLMLISITFLTFMRFGNILFASQIFLAAYFEWKMNNLEKIKLSAMILLCAFTFWLLDVFKILCHPGNHILTGHGIWHLLCAVSIYIMFTAYIVRNRISSISPPSPPLS